MAIQHEPFAMVFDSHNRIVGVVVLEPDGRWHASVCGKDCGHFGSEEGAKAFFIRLA
jgi:hypothetical protein